jgi:hypothetical protein
MFGNLVSGFTNTPFMELPVLGSIHQNKPNMPTSMKPTFLRMLAAALVACSVLLGWEILARPDPQVVHNATTRTASNSLDSNLVAVRPQDQNRPAKSTRNAVSIGGPRLPLLEIEGESSLVGTQTAENWKKIQTRLTYVDFLEAVGMTVAMEEQLLDLISSRYVGETAHDQENSDRTEMEIQILLGNNWHEFVNYESQMEERIYVMQCNEVMTAHQAPFSAEQRRLMVEAIIDAQEAGFLWNSDGDNPLETTLEEALLRSAGGILEPHQLEPFREALRIQKNSGQMAFHVGSEIFDANGFPDLDDLSD